MARRSKQPTDEEKDFEGAEWHIGAPMMPRLAEELARVVAHWSRLEHMINGLICQLSGIGLNLGDVFFHNISMPARYMILESVAVRYLKDKDPYVCESLLKCAAKVRNYQKRNQLVHGLWLRGGLEFAVTEHASRKSHKRERITWTLKDLIKTGNEISTLIMNFWAHIEAVDEMFPQPPAEHRPWRRKPPLRPPRTLQRLYHRH